MIKFFQWIYTLYSGLLFILLMLVFGLFIILPILISERGDKISFVFIRLWAGIWAALSGIRFEVHGLEHIDKSTSYIYIFNHRSFIDAPMIPLCIPQEVRAIGKKELFLKKGISIVVAPEGTRNDTKDPLLPFQRGAFRLAIETRIPILPMAVIGADRIMKRGSILLRPGNVRVYFSQAMMPPENSETAVKDFTEKGSARLEAMILTHE